MKRKQRVAIQVAIQGALFALFSIGPAAEAGSTGTAFTYQGQLKQDGAPLNGTVDLEFRLFDLAEGGAQQGSTVLMDDVLVENGLIAVALDFGDVFDGNRRWLEVCVRDGASSGAFTPLAPRQELTPAPYARFALNGPVGSDPWQTSGANIFNTNTGNVGVGTPAPGMSLEVSTPSYYDKPAIGASDGGAYAYLHVTDGTAHSVIWDSTRDMRFGTETQRGGGYVERMRITASGRVGIGTRSPVMPLQIGDVNVPNSLGMMQFASRSGTGFSMRAWNVGVPETDEDFSSFGNGYKFVIDDPLQGTVPEFAIDWFDGHVAINTSVNPGQLPGQLTVKAEPNAYAAIAAVTNNTNQLAFYATNTTGGSAARFIGNVQVEGELCAYRVCSTVKNFRIDHPLDPQNRYLYHASVESSEMKNFYDGTVVTDHRGYATVELPQWFEALNTDFRYQLTVIDEGDSDVFVLAKVVRPIKQNRFTIRTSEPSVKVSWQVTGVRQDAYAKAYPLQVEVEKPEHERGRDRHPEVHGISREHSFDRERLHRTSRMNKVSSATRVPGATSSADEAGD